jgi:TetR/AcrR family transcriptional regulator, tetracycline repressor protein
MAGCHTSHGANAADMVIPCVINTNDSTRASRPAARSGNAVSRSTAAKPSAVPRNKLPAELTVRRIVDVATRIVEGDGLDKLTMRRLAAELGVTPMAFYGHVPTKGRLQELIADRYLADLDLAESSRRWDTRLLRIFTSFRDHMLEHPILAQVLTAQTVDVPATHRMADTVLGILRDHGFSDREAVEMFAILANFTVGWVVGQQARAHDLPDRIEELGAADEYPNLKAVAAEYVKWPRSKAFERGLRHLMSVYR